jgi:protocatechuate 3,4-dioxygenase beta subunit
MDTHTDDHDLGLNHDLTLIAGRSFGRRTALKFAAGAGLATLGATAFGPLASAATLTEIPEETAGPYPGDGSNGVNVLTQSGIVRSDIRSSFGSMSGTAAGVPLTITLQVIDSTNGGVVSGAAVYLWHCDRDGKYSLYSSGVTNQNYLRGVQQTDADGRGTFTSIFPACYSGRWPHIHFEVYPSVATATSSASKIATSQLALPEDVCTAVYATSGYSTSVTNLAKTSLATDNVFSDGWNTQVPTVTGDVTNGYTASLVVVIDADGAGAGSGSSGSTSDATVTPTTSPTSIGATSAFTPLASPVRVLDTRNGIGVSSGRPGAGSTVTLPVAGVSGVPSDATALVFNLTAADASAAGFVTAWGDGSMPLASNLNLDAPGQTRPNLVTVPIGADGSIRLYTSNGAHLVADAVGSFRATSSASAGRLVTVTPTRVLDTRNAIGFSGAKPTGGSTVTLALAGRGGLPSSGVSAVVLNVTAAAAEQSGYVTVWPDGAQPVVSNLNVVSGDTIANQVVVRMGSDGQVRLATTAATHLLADVVGWFTDGTATASTAGLFVPITPYRVLDTRSGGRPAAGTTITVLAAASGAAGATALAMNVTATGTAAAGYLTAWPDGTRPVVSCLNVTAADQTIANHAECKVGSDGGVRLYTDAASHLVADISGWYV